MQKKTKTAKRSSNRRKHVKDK